MVINNCDDDGDLYGWILLEWLCLCYCLWLITVIMGLIIILMMMVLKQWGL